MSNSYFGKQSVVYRLHADPAMLVGGLRALLQQALHPEAMAGVAAHSNFREDAWGRLQRTGDYVGTLTYSPISEADKLAARVRMVHTKLKLDDPKLLLWVHMAMVDAFLDVAIRSGFKISNTERDQYIFEMVKFAELVGVPAADTPNSFSQLKEYFEKIKPELSASDDAKRAALFIAIPPMPTFIRLATPAAPTWGAIATLAAASLPKWARKLYNWPMLPGQDLVTDISLKTLRTSLFVLPDFFRKPPQLVAAEKQKSSAKPKQQ